MLRVRAGSDSEFDGGLSVELREALNHADLYRGYLERPDVPIAESFKVILSAARRELERQEKKFPNLESMEASLRNCPGNVGPAWGSIGNHGRAADILKALREKVVPWLRNIERVEFVAGYRPPTGCWSTVEMLHALGEEP